MTAMTVKGQGHAPLLRDAPTIEAIRGFLVGAEAPAYVPQAMYA
jgi:hypothetical protein